MITSSTYSSHDSPEAERNFLPNHAETTDSSQSRSTSKSIVNDSLSPIDRPISAASETQERVDTRSASPPRMNTNEREESPFETTVTVDVTKFFQHNTEREDPLRSGPRGGFTRNAVTERNSGIRKVSWPMPMLVDYRSKPLTSIDNPAQRSGLWLSPSFNNSFSSSAWIESLLHHRLVGGHPSLASKQHLFHSGKERRIAAVLSKHSVSYKSTETQLTGILLKVTSLPPK